MKKEQIILIFAFVVMLIFPACTSSENPAELPKNEGGDSSLSDQYLDKDLFDQAVSRSDQSICEKILSGEVRTDCNSAVDAMKKTNEAQIGLDQTLCNEITLERYKDECISKVKRAQYYENLQENRKELYDQALLKKDITICEENQDQNFKDECIYAVLTNPGYDNEGKKEQCNKINDSMLKNQCISELEA